MSALATIAVLAATGLVLFFLVANLVDVAVFGLAFGKGDPVTDLLAGGPNPTRVFMLNAVRPALLTLIIFGGGLLAIGLLGVGTWGSVAGGVWFFLLTQYACLAGRGASLNQAGWAMVITMAALIAAFVAMTRPTLTAEEEQSLRNFARSIREDREATRAFNRALGSGSGIVTLPEAFVEEQARRREKALELLKNVENRALDRVHPELGRMVRDHYQKYLEFSVQALRTGSPMASLQSQRHQNAFADWWDSHKGSMPLLVPILKEVGVR